MTGAEVLFDAATAASVRALMIRATNGCACTEGETCRLLAIACKCEKVVPIHPLPSVG